LPTSIFAIQIFGRPTLELPMSKKSLSSHLSRRDPDDAEFEQVINEIHKGSDRVAAIMAAAYVDSNLAKLISASLADGSDSRALFHDEGAPFGTFKRKIVAGLAMGLFPQKVADDLDRIRDIRNQFAHALLSLNFENEHIKRECGKLGNYRYRLRRRQKVGSTRLRFEKACWAIGLAMITKANDFMDGRLEQLGAEIAALQQSDPDNILGNIEAINRGVEH
jgi:hypothetical protein